MNRIYRTVWNVAKGQWQVAPETVKSQGKSRSRGTRTVGTLASLAVGSILLLPLSAFADGLPSGGEVRAGEGSIEQSGSEMRINQKSDRMAIDWEDFSIDAGSRVEFIQPGRNSAALNRVTGDQLSRIRGAIEANGQVFLVNPNGIVFGDTAQVDVGGLVASTLDISPDEFMAGNFTFEGDSSSAIVNQGNIRTADEGYVALIAAEIINEGSITAPRGDVLMGAGSRVTLDMGGPIKIEVEQARLDTYIEQGGAIKADGGRVYLTAKAAGDLAASVINHTGVTQAQTLAENEQGEIWLMGDMESGETRVAGTLDASAPDGGDGGFVETSAAKVTIKDEATVTTRADDGKTGEWLIDPYDFAIAESGGDLTGTALSSALGNNDVMIETTDSTPGCTNVACGSIDGGGNGDIFVNDEVNWSSGNTLTLSAGRDIEINQTIDASQGSGGKLALEYGQSGSGGEYRLNASVDLQAGQNFSTNGTNYTVITELESTSGNTSLADLQGDGSHLTGNYALGADIDASDTANWNSDDNGKPAGWLPIGGSQQYDGFEGILTGLGHTVRDLTIYRPDRWWVGLLSVGKGAIIRDIGLVGGSIEGDRYVGGLVGNHTHDGTVRNAFSTSKVSGSFVVGGLIGRTEDAKIINSYAAGDVNLSGYNGGGLVGSGQRASSFNNSYAAGEVTGAGTIGGLVGNIDDVVSIKNSYYATTNADGNSVNNDYDNTIGSGQTYANLTKPGTFGAWGSDIDDKGSTGTTWRIYDGHTLPILRSFLTPVTVTPDDASNKTYDGNNKGIASYATDLSGVTLEGNLEYLTNSADVNVYRTNDDSLTFSGLYSGPSGYDISYDVGAASVSINKADATVTANSDTVTYDGTEQSVTGYTVSGLVNGETKAVLDSVTTTGGSGTDAGGYVHKANGSDNNYDLSFIDGALTIEEAEATVTANSDTVTYDGTEQSVTGYTVSGLVNGETKAVLDSVSTTGGSGTDAGRYIHSVSGTDNNYNLTFKKGELSIVQRAIRVAADDQSKTRGAADPELTWQITEGTLAGDDALAGGLSREVGDSAGKYAIQQGSLDELNNSNYAIDFIEGQLTIVVPPEPQQQTPQRRMDSVVNQTLQAASSPSEQDRSNRLMPNPPNPEILLGGIQIMAGGINTTLNNDPEGDN